MSLEYYLNWWIAKRKDFEQLYQKDEEFREKKKPIQTRQLANKLVGGLYVRYALIVQEIDACLDQIAQPQKRESIRKLMDAATIRLCELNEEMKEIDISEYHYVDGELIELKLVPYDIEILHPALMYPRPIDIEDMWKKLKNGEAIFTPPPPPEPEPEVVEGEEGKAEEGAAMDGQPEQPAEAPPAEDQAAAKPETETTETEDKKKDRKSKKEKAEKPKETPQFVIEEKELTPEEIEQNRKNEIISANVKIIQVAERGRQERLYFMEKYGTESLSKRLAADPTLKPPKPPDRKTALAAAMKIQRIWRGHSVREMVKYKEQKRRLLIGMSEPSFLSKAEFVKLERNLNKRREYRDQRIREYLESFANEKARVLRVISPGLFEDIGDEIREWFRVFHERIRMFHPYPTEEEGGTIIVIRGETMTPEEFLQDYLKKQKEKDKAKKVDKKAEREKRKKEKQKAKQQAKKAREQEKKKKAQELARKQKMKEKGEYEYDYQDTVSKPLYDQGVDELRRIWDHKDEFKNPLEKHYMEMITDQECYETQLEVRKQVDELMRIELDLLMFALEMDKYISKGKKGKKPKMKKPKKKKAKKKGKKGKKDPTGNRTTEDLFQELFDAGIIRTYPTGIWQYTGGNK